jgi:hypothetical protein
LASGVLCSNAACFWFRGLQRLDLPWDLPFACACLCLVLDRLVRAFFLFAGGARVFSANTTPASLTCFGIYIVGGKRKHMNVSTRSCSSHVNLLQLQHQEDHRGRLADVVGIITAWFAVCLMPVDCIAVRQLTSGHTRSSNYRPQTDHSRSTPSTS